MSFQHTIGGSASLSGVGLHTGVKATVTINPAPENYGIRFIRTDIESSPVILADIDNVVDNSRGTAIGIGDVRIYTIEHIMSAFAGMRIDNCRVEVNAIEIPLMDGSALPFVEMIKKVGKQQQTAERHYLVIDKPMHMYKKDDIELSVFPADYFHITLMVDYKNPSLGVQHTTVYSMDDYEKDFAPARTFCFLSEIEQLREKGLIKGGSIHSAVVVQDIPMTKEHINYMKKLFPEQGDIVAGSNGFLNNTQLHFPNELCRHKAVDLIGDLYLLGKPLRGHVLGARTGHAANIEMARKIRHYIKQRDTAKQTVDQKNNFDFQYILNLLPHRYPFLLVDKVESMEAGKRIVAYKNVSFNEHFFQGHFPSDPVMPGVLQIEALAQAAGILGMNVCNISQTKSMLFLSIDKAKFRNQVRPGDCLRLEVELIKARGTTMRFAAKALVENTVACEAELLAMIR